MFPLCVTSHLDGGGEKAHVMGEVLRCRKEPTTTVLQLAALVGTYDIKLASEELMWVSHEAPRRHTHTLQHKLHTSSRGVFG